MNQTTYQIEDLQNGQTWHLNTCAGAVGALGLTDEQKRQNKVSWKYSDDYKTTTVTITPKNGGDARVYVVKEMPAWMAPMCRGHVPTIKARKAA